MASGVRNRPGLVIETLLFYLRHRYLAATECLLFLFLYEIADETGLWLRERGEPGKAPWPFAHAMSELPEASRAARIDRNRA